MYLMEKDKKARDPRGRKGVMRPISGRYIDLSTLTTDDVTLADVAFGLGRTLRYGGHINTDWTVAHHSIVMSYLEDVNPMEALLHDAGEAYTGDIIWPVKALFPEIEQFENRVTGVIMEALDPDYEGGDYEKSESLKEADLKLYEWECFSLGREGVYHPDVESALMQAGEDLEEHYLGTGAPWVAYARRWFDISFTGDELDKEIEWAKLRDSLMEVWYPNPTAEEETEEDETEANASVH